MAIADCVATGTMGILIRGRMCDPIEVRHADGQFRAINTRERKAFVALTRMLIEVSERWQLKEVNTE